MSKKTSRRTNYDIWKEEFEEFLKRNGLEFEIDGRLYSRFGGSIILVRDENDEKFCLYDLTCLHDFFYNNIKRLRRTIHEFEAMKRFGHHPLLQGVSKVYELPENPEVLDSLKIKLNHGIQTRLVDYLIDSPPLDEKTVKLIIYQILKGLEYLHDRGLHHETLNVTNTLIDKENLHVVLTEYGLQRTSPRFSSGDPWMPDNYYQSPEQLLMYEDDLEALDWQSDIWAVGCILGELINSRKKLSQERLDKKFFNEYDVFDQKRRDRVLFYSKHNNMISVAKKILRTLGVPSDEEHRGCPQSVRFVKMMRQDLGRGKKKLRKFEFLPEATDLEFDLLRKLLVYDFKKRITVKEALKHELFDGMKDKTKKEEEGESWMYERPLKLVGKDVDENQSEEEYARLQKEFRKILYDIVVDFSN